MVIPAEHFKSQNCQHFIKLKTINILKLKTEKNKHVIELKTINISLKLKLSIFHKQKYFAASRQTKIK